MQIIPAIYIHHGKAAAYRPGDYQNISYLEQDPYDLIEQLGQLDVQRIYLIDIDAYQNPGQNNKGLIGSLSNVCIPDLEVGGGINDLPYLKSLQYAGVDYFVLSSVLFENQPILEEIAATEDIPNERIIIGIDLKDGRPTTRGWTQTVTDPTLREFMRTVMSVGFQRFVMTDIKSDRPKDGPDLAFFTELREEFPEAKIAVGGHVHTFEQIDQLKKIGIEEVIVGDDIYRDEGLLARISAYNREEAGE